MAQVACRLFQKGACTGCTRLDVPYARQLEAKEKFVKEQVGTAAAPDAFRPIVRSPDQLAYRTSVKLCLHEDREGRRAVGLYRGGTRQVVTLGDCPAQVDAINRFTAKLFDRRVRPAARFYDHQGRVFQRNRLKFLTIRAAPDAKPTGEGIGVLIAHTGVERKALSAWLAHAGVKAASAYETKLTKGDGDRLTGRETHHLTGPEYFRFPLAGRVFELSPASFFQANHSLSGKLIDAATAFAADGDLLLDLYGGFGAYALSAAPRFKGVRLVDGNGDAIRSAKGMSESLPDFKPFAAMCEDYLARDLTLADKARVTHAIVNPPRGGISPTVVSALAPKNLPLLREIHYVSCNPVTLARDLRALSAQGFKVSSVQPFDMFPQTDHVEVVAKLQRVH